MVHKKKRLAICYILSLQCRALAKRLSIAKKTQETLTEEMKQANQSITSLQVIITAIEQSKW